MGQAPALRRLVDLLKLLFSADDLPRWLHPSSGRAVADEPGPDLAQLAFEVAMALERQGLIGPPLFAALIEERPAQREEILAVARDMRADASPDKDKSPSMGADTMPDASAWTAAIASTFAPRSRA